MTKQIKAFLSIAGLIVLLAVAVIAYNTLMAKYGQQLPQGETEQIESAPDFTVYDDDGNAVNLSTFKGKPVVINFWASWCVYCDKEMPHFDALAEELKDKVEFVMINSTDGSKETKETAKQYLTDNGYKFKPYFDTDLSAGTAFNIRGLPASFFIDKDGNIVRKAFGLISEEKLREYVELISE